MTAKLIPRAWYGDKPDEAIVSDTHDSPIEIELSNLNASDGIKKKIREEFKFVCELLDFDKKAHEIFRNWYIDGRLYYHVVVDRDNPEDGVRELRYIDPRKIKKIRKIPIPINIWNISTPKIPLSQTDKNNDLKLLNNSISKFYIAKILLLQD